MLIAVIMLVPIVMLVSSLLVPYPAIRWVAAQLTSPSPTSTP
ncbi:MAG: hypothetical protein U1E26_09185 [Coriobacteriia bacterium]|nr:hypothetical protein [Coriobacteriia bacterium]